MKEKSEKRLGEILGLIGLKFIDIYSIFHRNHDKELQASIRTLDKKTLAEFVALIVCRIQDGNSFDVGYFYSDGNPNGTRAGDIIRGWGGELTFYHYAPLPCNEYGGGHLSPIEASKMITGAITGEN